MVTLHFKHRQTDANATFHIRIERRRPTLGIWSVCEQVMGINLDGFDLDSFDLEFWYLDFLHLHSF